MSNLRILIISQYFWPENFRVNELSEELNKLGHKVTILTGYPNYPSGRIFEEFKKNKSKFNKYKGVDIIRVPLLPRKNNKFNLLLNYLSFLLTSIIFGYFKMFGRNFDIIFTFQLSPVTVGITSSFFSFIKNCPNIFWVLDLWPDTLVALKVLKRKWQIKLFKILINWIYSNCDIVLAQSKSILKELKNYTSIKNNAYYFPSWGESNLFFKNNKPAPEVIPKKIFTILFAGNIGEAQDFPNVIRAVNNLSNQNINNFRVILIGEGSKKEWVKKEVKKLGIDKYFEFHKNYPLNRMGSFFLHADALLVSLSNNKVFNMTIPGKLQFYLSSGIPIIGMICGEGAQVIKDSKAGYVCESGDYIGLSKIICKLIKVEKKLLKDIGRKGKEYAEKEFSKNLLIIKLNNLLIKTSKKNSQKYKK